MAFALLVSVLVCGVWFGPHVQAQQLVNTCKVCPSGWAVFEGRCYLFNIKEKEWIDAERACTSLGGNLASLRNAKVIKFIQDMIYTTTGSYVKTWVGGHDSVKEGMWLWSDGFKFALKDWGQGEPNNKKGREHCMEINFKGKYVNDENCSTMNSYICARDMI